MVVIYITAIDDCEILDDIDFMSDARTIRFSLDGIPWSRPVGRKPAEAPRLPATVYQRRSYRPPREPKPWDYRYRL